MVVAILVFIISRLHSIFPQGTAEIFSKKACDPHSVVVSLTHSQSGLRAEENHDLCLHSHSTIWWRTQLIQRISHTHVSQNNLIIVGIKMNINAMHKNSLNIPFIILKLNVHEVHSGMTLNKTFKYCDDTLFKIKVLYWHWWTFYKSMQSFYSLSLLF